MKLYKMKVVGWKHQHGTEGIEGRRLGRPWPQNGLSSTEEEEEERWYQCSYIGVGMDFTETV
jgi:hypothetical protein